MSFLIALQNQKNKLKETDTTVTNVDGQRFIETKNDVKTLLNPKTYGFVIDTKPDDVPILIVDHLYIGSQDCTANTVINAYNIKHVLSLGINVSTNVDQKYVECLDIPDTNIKPILLNSLPYIRKAIECKENVLVHCNAGVSRTSMVTIGYLMQYHSMFYEDAYKLVKEKRPAIRPNDGFVKQLKCMKTDELI